MATSAQGLPGYLTWTLEKMADDKLDIRTPNVPPPRSYSNLFPVSSTFFTVKLIHPQRGGDLPLHPLSTISSRFAHCRNEVRISFQLSDKSATCRGRLRAYNLKRRNCATGRWLKNFIENFPRKERRRLKLSKVFLHDVNVVCYFYSRMIRIEERK